MQPMQTISFLHSTLSITLMTITTQYPILQVALDILESDRAIEIAKEAVSGGVDWIEVGTPLIKADGMNSIRKMRAAFSDNTILADMKTIDTGALEVEMAAKAGADIVILLGACDDSTIRDALQSAQKYGVKLMADMIASDNVHDRALQLQDMGVDYICIHVGIDQQMMGMDAVSALDSMVSDVRIPIAVAGGLDDESSALAIAAGASIVVVGGNIVRSQNAKMAANRIKERIRSSDVKGAVTRSKKSIDTEIYEMFMQVSTSHISDAMHRKGAMQGIKKIAGGKFAAKAVTVQNFEGDWAKPVEAIDVAKKGEVIVIYNGSADVAPWGELATLSCINKKIAAVVIDGAVRDVEEICELDFPVFAKSIVPNAGEPKGYGGINTEIMCCGQTVNPGDWVVGDSNGVVVIPAERAYEIARRSIEVEKTELRLRDEILRGRSLSEILKLSKWEVMD